MNKYKLSALLTEAIQLKQDFNIPKFLNLSEEKLYNLRRKIREDLYTDRIIEFESEMSMQEIIEILQSEDSTVIDVFIKVIKNNEI